MYAEKKVQFARLLAPVSCEYEIGDGRPIMGTSSGREPWRGESERNRVLRGRNLPRAHAQVHALGYRLSRRRRLRGCLDYNRLEPRKASPQRTRKSLTPARPVLALTSRRAFYVRHPPLPARAGPTRGPARVMAAVFRFPFGALFVEMHGLAGGGGGPGRGPGGYRQPCSSTLALPLLSLLLSACMIF